MEAYVNNRLKVQTKWYETSATHNKKQFITYQTWIIILGAVIPVLVAFETVFPDMKNWNGPLAAVISAIIAILAGLDKLYQPQPNWFNYRANEEMLKKEEWLHKYKAGPYKNLKDDEEANRLLVERTEAIISADIARTLNFDKSKDGAQAQPGAALPGVAVAVAGLAGAAGEGAAVLPPTDTQTGADNGSDAASAQQIITDGTQ